MTGRKGRKVTPAPQANGDLANLEDMDRSRTDGFRLYWSKRKRHYTEVFGTVRPRIVWLPEDLAHVADLWAAVIEQAKYGAGEEFPPNLDFFTEEGGMYDWIRDHA